MEDNNIFGNNQNSGQVQNGLNDGNGTQGESRPVSLSKQQPEQNTGVPPQGTAPSFAQVVQSYQQSGGSQGQQGAANLSFGAQSQGTVNPSFGAQSQGTVAPPFGAQSQGTVNPPFGAQGQQGTINPPFGAQGQQGTINPPFGAQGQETVNSPFGAQGQQYSGGYQGGDIGASVPQPPPKKSRAGIIFGIAAVLAVVLVGVFAWRVFRNPLSGVNPQELLDQGMETMTKEMEAYASSVSEDVGFDAIRELQRESPMQINTDLTFVLPSTPDYEDIDFDVKLDLISDWKNEKASAELSVGAYGFDMPVVDIVADGASNSMYFNIPLLADEVYSLDFTNFGEEFNASAWARLFDEELPTDYSLDLFGENVETTEVDENRSELEGIAVKYADFLSNAKEVTAVREKKAFWVGDKEVKCSGVAVRVPKDAFNQFMEGYKEDIMNSQYYQSALETAASRNALSGAELERFRNEVDETMELLLGLQVEQDFVMHIYLDAKGRIVNISTPEDIVIEGGDMDSLAVDFNFTGEDRAMDIVSGRVYFKSKSEEIYIGIDRSAEVNEERYKEDIEISLGETGQIEDILMKYQNEWNYQDKSFDILLSLEADSGEISLSAAGAFQDIVKGEKYTLKVDNATLHIDGEDLIILSGTIATEPADKEIQVPTLSIDLLDMSEEDIDALINGAGAPSYY